MTEYVNVEFEEGELTHGTRYTICIHANPREIKTELWTQILPEINACSDGIIVDLTSPVKGNVWIGNIPTITHQVLKYEHFTKVKNQKNI